MKLYIFHIILLTIKTCAPLDEGEMLKTIHNDENRWKVFFRRLTKQQIKIFFSPIKFLFALSTFNCVWQKQLSVLFFLGYLVHLNASELYFI